MQLAVWCVAWKLANSAKNTILQALQFQNRNVCHEFSGGGGMSHYRPSNCFVER